MRATTRNKRIGGQISERGTFTRTLAVVQRGPAWSALSALSALSRCCPLRAMCDSAQPASLDQPIQHGGEACMCDLAGGPSARRFVRNA